MVYILLLLIIGGVVYICLFDYPQKTEDMISKILGIDDAELISFDYVDNGNFKDNDAIELYELSNNTIHKFLTTSSFILYDEYYESSPIWKKINWNKSPIDLSKWNDIYISVFGTLRTNKKQNEWINDMNKLLDSSNAYYSLYYKNKMDSFVLFLLDIKECKLYCTYFSY